VLLEPTIEKLNSMRLIAMAKTLRDWNVSIKDPPIEPQDLIGLLTDAEWVYRENAKLSSRIRRAKLKEPACVEDINYAHPRGLQKIIMNELSTSKWIFVHQNIILTGPTGVGKTYLACALGNKACREGYSVYYRRVSRLFDDLAQARAEGNYPNLLQRLAKAQVLILDDFGLQPLTANERKDLLEVLEDRYGNSSTIVTSQLEPNKWHPMIGDETLADSICDRLVHNAHRIQLKGESMRKEKKKTKELQD
jgi:DNA replication protein DnaC